MKELEKLILIYIYEEYVLSSFIFSLELQKQYSDSFDYYSDFLKINIGLFIRL